MYTQLKNKRLVLGLSLLLIGSAPLMAAPTNNTAGIVVAGDAALEVVKGLIENPRSIVAGSTDNAYYFKVVNTGFVDFVSLRNYSNLHPNQSHVTWLEVTPEEAKKVDPTASACQFFAAGLKVNQACVIKFNLDAKDLLVGDEVEYVVDIGGITSRKDSKDSGVYSGITDTVHVVGVPSN